MKLGIDEYAHLNSPLHRWDPRYKFIGLMALIFTFSFIQDLRMIPAMIVVTSVVYAVSGLPASFMVTRLRYPSVFLLVVILLLPFVSGETVLISLGPFDLRQEGLVDVLLIATRFLCILTVGLVLFGTAPFFTTIRSMRAMGLPAILTDIALLSFRYIGDIGDDLQRMETSMKLRGFHDRRFSWHGLSVLAWLGGSILVRSYEQSEWVYKAMILRGYGQNIHYEDEFRASSRDKVILSIIFLIAAGFIAGGIVYGHM